MLGSRNRLKTGVIGIVWIFGVELFVGMFGVVSIYITDRKVRILKVEWASIRDCVLTNSTLLRYVTSVFLIKL